MKKIYMTFLACLFFAGLIKAQDTIILKYLDIIVGKVTEINDNEIKYTLVGNINGPSFSIYHNKVAGIKYPYGQPDIFDSFKYNSYFETRKKNLVSVADTSRLIPKKSEVTKDSIIYRLQAEQLSTKKRIEDLEQKNKTMLINQRKQDSIILIFMKQQDDKDHEIHTIQQQNNDKSQEILDTLINFKAKLISNQETKKKDEKWKPRMIGLGLNLGEVLLGSSLYNNTGGYVPGTILITVTPIRNFRVEIEFSAIFSKGSKTDFMFTGGLLGMWQKSKFNFYGGLKLMRYANYDQTIISPTVGSEYIMANHFSVGAEVGLPFVVNNAKDAAMIVSFNRFIFRYYF